MPAIASDPIAANALAGIILGVSKPSGDGNMASKVTNPVAMASPMPPLNAVSIVVKSPEDSKEWRVNV